jgi:hypothetical protein
VPELRCLNKHIFWVAIVNIWGLLVMSKRIAALLPSCGLDDNSSGTRRLFDCGILSAQA